MSRSRGHRYFLFKQDSVCLHAYVTQEGDEGGLHPYKLPTGGTGDADLGHTPTKHLRVIGRLARAAMEVLPLMAKFVGQRGEQQRRGPLPAAIDIDPMA